MRPEANYLILRHFHIGSEILQFVAANVPGVQIPLLPLRPRTLEDLIDNVFLQHDLNIFNFLIRLNQELRDKGVEIQARTHFDTGGITTGMFDIDQESEKTRESFRMDGPRDAKDQLDPAKVNYFDFVSRLFFTPDDYGCYFAAYDGTDCTASDVKLAVCVDAIPVKSGSRVIEWQGTFEQPEAA